MLQKRREPSKRTLSSLRLAKFRIQGPRLLQARAWINQIAAHLSRSRLHCIGQSQNETKYTLQFLIGARRSLHVHSLTSRSSCYGSSQLCDATLINLSEGIMLLTLVEIHLPSNDTPSDSKGLSLRPACRRVALLRELREQPLSFCIKLLAETFYFLVSFFALCALLACFVRCLLFHAVLILVEMVPHDPKCKVVLAP